jgi:hypothetical protein
MNGHAMACAAVCILCATVPMHYCITASLHSPCYGRCTKLSCDHHRVQCTSRSLLQMYSCTVTKQLQQPPAAVHFAAGCRGAIWGSWWCTVHCAYEQLLPRDACKCNSKQQLRQTWQSCLKRTFKTCKDAGCAIDAYFVGNTERLCCTSVQQQTLAYFTGQ